MDDLDALIGELNATSSGSGPLLEASSRVEEWLAWVVRPHGKHQLPGSGRPPGGGLPADSASRGASPVPVRGARLRRNRL